MKVYLFGLFARRISHVRLEFRICITMLIHLFMYPCILVFDRRFYSCSPIKISCTFHAHTLIYSVSFKFNRIICLLHFIHVWTCLFPYCFHACLCMPYLAYFIDLLESPLRSQARILRSYLLTAGQVLASSVREGSVGVPVRQDCTSNRSLELLQFWSSSILLYLPDSDVFSVIALLN